LCGREEGAPPPVDLDAEKRNGDFIRSLIREVVTKTVHDVSDGGLVVALAEMAIASGGIGAVLKPPLAEAPGHAYWFGEDQARYVVVVAASAVDGVLARAAAAGVPTTHIGVTGGEALILAGERPLRIKGLTERFERWFPTYMSGATG
jgi:phosphoribosylformylglycinamidine synthase